MKILEGKESESALELLLRTADVAKNATCLRAKCGSLIIKDNRIIGVGFNSPPGDLESQRRCHCEKDSYHKKVTDKTCCMHAEERAIKDALASYPDKLKGSRLYFVRLKNEQPARSGKPYCTKCSKAALDAGIAEFVLWHKEGITVYNTEEYNKLSYEYKE